MSTSTSEVPSIPSTSTPQKPVSVLFVCLGNICRSPMAEAVFRHLTHPSHPLIETIDSAGTGAWHVGSAPDPRTMKVLHKNGVTGYKHAARMVTQHDFEAFDWIFAMDEDNYTDLLTERRKVARKLGKKEKAEDVEARLATVVLYGDCGGTKGEEVVDPYYGGDNGFDVAFEQMMRFGKGFLQSLEGNKEKISTV